MSDGMTTDRICVHACTSQMQDTVIASNDGFLCPGGRRSRPWLAVLRSTDRRSLRIADGLEPNTPQILRRDRLVSGKSCSSLALA